MQFDLPDAHATEELGQRLASTMRGRGIVALVGPLGAGKTTFAKGFANGLGVEEVVSSPTFTMLNEYTSGRLPLYHLDLYRVRETGEATESASTASLEWLESELEELISADGVVLIEWANFMDAWIAQHDCVLVELNYSTKESSSANDDSADTQMGRIARISAFGQDSTRIVDTLA